MLGIRSAAHVWPFVLQHALVLDGLVPRLQTVAEMRQALPQECHSELSRDEMQYRLAQAHIAQADPRGSDVRLDTGEI